MAARRHVTNDAGRLCPWTRDSNAYSFDAARDCSGSAPQRAERDPKRRLYFCKGFLGEVLQGSSPLPVSASCSVRLSPASQARPRWCTLHASPTPDSLFDAPARFRNETIRLGLDFRQVSPDAVPAVITPP